MERRENDKLLPEHAKDASYPEDWWLDEADSADGLPVFAMDEAEDFVKDRQRLKGVPMVTGYEALERHRGIRRPRRKLSRREQRAWEKAQKYEAKLHKAQEKEDKKRAKQEAKLAAREEKAAQKQAKKEKKYKKQTKPTASSSAKSSGKKCAAKKVSSNKKGGNKEKKITAQQSIPYREMGKDGICRVEDGYYSKTIRFYDINYQLAQNEDKNAIFENWCDFLNYFDSTIHFQLSFINHHALRSRKTVLMICVWSLLRCSETSWQREIMVLSEQSILHLESKQTISGKQNRNWSVSKRIFSITLRY